jgi:hypothetical protein
MVVAASGWLMAKAFDLKPQYQKPPVLALLVYKLKQPGNRTEGRSRF